MDRRFAAASIALAALITASLPSAVSAATGGALATARAPRADPAAQTFGSAVRYGMSSPVAASASPAAPRGALTRRDAGLARMFTRHASRALRASTPKTLMPPSPRGTRVVSNPGAATGFNGLDHADQRNAGTGKYTQTQFSLEPPDQGLCVGNGFVVEPINDAFRVFGEHGTALTGVTALNQFYLRSPAIIRAPNPANDILGDFLSDPKCYFDPVSHRFIQTVLEMDAPGPSNTFPFFQRSHILIAVSRTANPTGMWNLYSLDTSDDGLNGTPVHTQCPCLPDQPLLGANRDGVFIDTNEFENNAQGFFNGGQMYALSRSRLESGAARVRFVHLDVGTVSTGDPNLPFWGSIQPATSLDPRHDTELFMTGGPEDQFQNNAPLDNRIAVWSLTGTRSLGDRHPHVALRHRVLTSETYGLPINTGATQKNGPTPLRDAINAAGGTEVLEKINANDSRMNQVVDVHGILYGGVNTTVTRAASRPRVGIAFFVVGAAADGGFLSAHILNQGYVAVSGQNVLFPSIAVNASGSGAMAFTLSGPRFFPSAAYVRFAFGRPVGAIHISGAGVLPEDGFTGYKAFGSPTPGVARWGDYSAAVAADGAIWMGNEFIPGTPRTVNANWGTFITRLPT
jgi:hypothetical protein